MCLGSVVCKAPAVFLPDLCAPLGLLCQRPLVHTATSHLQTLTPPHLRAPPHPFHPPNPHARHPCSPPPRNMH